MCRPTHYTIAYEINPWMHLTRQTARPRALRQWGALYRLLTQRLRAKVQLLPPVQGLPDLIFTANAGLIVGRTCIRSNFRHPERQGEEAVVERYFTQRGFRVMRLPRRFNFEGEGDALFVGGSLFLGHRFRTDSASHEHVARMLGCRVLPVELADRRFYHLDTCFCPLDARSILWFPKAFDRYGRRVIEQHVEEPIAVSERDALRFACNAVILDGAIVMHRGVSAGLRKLLERRGLAVHELDLSEFLKAGGSAKCLVLRLDNRLRSQN